MLKFNKVLNSRIIALVLICVFLLTNTAYGIDLSEKLSLRKPLDFDDTKETKRYHRALSETADSVDGAPYAIPKEQSADSPVEAISREQLEQIARSFLAPGTLYTLIGFDSRLILDSYFSYASFLGDLPLLVIDGPSGIGKTSISKEIKVVMKDREYKLLYLNLDMFHTNRQKRWKIIDMVYSGKLNPNSFHEKNVFFNTRRIINMLKQIDSFRRTGKPEKLALKRVYNPENKNYENIEFNLVKNMIFVIDFKYGNQPEILPFYGNKSFRIRMEEDPAKVKEKWLKREAPIRTKEELVKLCVFYDKVIVPHYNSYAKETEKGLKILHLSPNDEEWSAGSPDAASLKIKSRLHQKKSVLLSSI